MDTHIKSKNPNPTTSMRVLTRPPPSPPPLPPPHSQPSPTPPPPTPPVSTGVAVVGFISRRRTDVSDLINRIIDADIFGSSRRDTPLVIPFSDGDEDEANDYAKEWFDCRRISYYHDADTATVFLQLSSTNCPAMRKVSEFDSIVDDLEFGDLQAMLFMFTVCHVIIYIQEGASFDTQNLKMLRVLQSAKHALVPFLRSHSILPSLGRPSSSSSRPTQATSSKSPSPRRGSNISSRNNSPISVMSGLGLYPALFPGQCTPVTLFAFVDDFSEMVNSSAASEESNDASSSSRSSTSSMVRSNQSLKGSSSVVVLSRPANKSESSFCKKMLSSLETQIRFLIKKCRPLTVSENSSLTGSRSGSISSSAPLLTLDASRAVVLLDSSGIRRGSSLDYATSLVEDVVSGKMTSDSLLLEIHSQNGMKEDILTLKEFINKQTDILRGKGGLVTNANSGSAAGVGMVAVAAAAAAAASAASGRLTTTPELPSLEMWISSSHLILKGILLGKSVSLDETYAIRRKFRQRSGAPPLVEGVAARPVDPPDIAVSQLESGKGINRKFSYLWCLKALPAAKEVYLKDLPPCYPTSVHEAQLEKALHAFLSMVKGSCVQEFVKKLQEECLSIWKSGRQLCDAISLTGKPCMHQKHDIENDNLSTEATGTEHKSGYVFLHACACGRSRKLRDDPFDIETANVKFNIFPDCDNLLPMLQLPKLNESRLFQPFPWTLVRLGGARYYEPSKGLLQAGFSPSEKFLLRWTIVLENDNPPSVSFANALRQGSASSKVDLKIVSTEAEDAKKSNKAAVEPGELQTGGEGHGKAVNFSHSENKISFGKGLPNITMRKAFSEVVAGSNSNSAFPPLQPKAQLISGPGKGGKRTAKVTSTVQTIISSGDFQISGKSKEITSAGSENSKTRRDNSHGDGNSMLDISKSVVPLDANNASNAFEVSVTDSGKTRFSPTCRHFVVYVGFEHECPRGHRYILSPEILNQLGQLDSLPEESPRTRPVEHGNRKHRGPVKLGKNDGHNKIPRLSNGNTINMEKVGNLERPTEARTGSDTAVNGLPHLFKPLDQATHDLSYSGADQQNPHYISLNDNGPAFSLLNRNIPIYLNCPHCSTSKNKDAQNLKFASSISQLQRIFVVTPPFPIVIAANPVVHFEASRQPTSVIDHDQPLQFSLGCQVILPPESSISIRLPFVYGIDVKDKGFNPLKPFEPEPELTGWLMQGTALQVIAKGAAQTESFSNT
ncbi:uncharacterized protein LOC141596143 [Silene latifolia]|uniref:uncharacterized protein LOC141596143 n=1 Tax=Silene latifolia TaxID=37657 RepID=UPI003D77AA61